MPDNFLTDYARNVQAVTKADVLRVAQRYLTGDKVAIVVVGDRASQEAPLRKLAPLELRDLDGGAIAAAKESGGLRPNGGKADTKSARRPGE